MTPTMDFLVSAAEQHELFGDFLPHQYGREAAARWSDSPQWAVAAERIADYDLIDWQDIRAEQEDWERRLVVAVTSGEPGDGPVAVALAEEQRRDIERWFHPCPPEQHRRMIEALLDDASFATRYEGLAAGTVAFLREAVRRNASGG